jgi:hypothetical protein
MADPAVLGLIGTLSGTAIGFAGGLVTQLLLEGKKQEAEKKKKKAEKLEELLSALYEYNNFVSSIRYVKNKTGEDRISTATFAKIEAITNIYFPQFSDQVEDFWSVACTRQEFRDATKPLSEHLDKVEEDYVNKFITLISDIKRCAKREFQ